MISRAMGKKITASLLEVGKSYLNESLYMYRTILTIDYEYKKVGYKNDLGSYGFCGTGLFAQRFPFEITEAEKEIIDQYNLKNYGKL